jgi:pimeloyl-ACP methyl ester carboxylesterase
MNLHHVRSGTGDPLLLLHPLGGSLVVWEPVTEELSRQREVIAADMPGFGDSPPLADGADPTPEALADGVAAFLDSLGIDAAHIGGNSLGAWVALELAKRGRARSVTGLCPAGFWARPLGPRHGIQPRTLARLLLPILPLLVRRPRTRALALGGSVARPERVSPEQALSLVRAYATSPAFDGANHAMRSALFAGIEEIDVPITLAWGELDTVVTEPRQRIPGARWIVLRGCGHLPTWDDPEQVAAVLLEGSS